MTSQREHLAPVRRPVGCAPRHRPSVFLTLLLTATCAILAPMDVRAQGLPTPSGDAVRTALGPRTTPEFQNEVLVLGTMHLAAHADVLRPEHLAPLLATLHRWAPTRIAVESIAPDEIALLAEREPHDPAAAQVLDMFARRALTLGRLMQERLGVGRIEAELRADALLASGAPQHPAARLELVALFLAAYEYDSATLQWSYLSEGARADAVDLPDEVRSALDRRLKSANEIVTLALPLARALGLQRIHAIDSQADGLRTLSAPQEALGEVYADPRRLAWRASDGARDGDAIWDSAFAAGDAMPAYRHANSVAQLANDAEQWAWLFETGHPSGVDRLRYQMWELRNQRMASNLFGALASTDRERLLLIVGASHKAYLDLLLATQLSVRLVQLSDLETPGG